MIRQGGGDINIVDAGESHPAEREELLAQVELRSIAGTTAFFTFGRSALLSLQTLQLRLNLGIALGVPTF